MTVLGVQMKVRREKWVLSLKMCVHTCVVSGFCFYDNFSLVYRHLNMYHDECQ